MFRHCPSTQYHKLSSAKTDDCEVQKKKNDRAFVDHNRSDIVDYDDLNKNPDRDDAALSKMVKPKKKKVANVKSTFDKTPQSLPKIKKKPKQGEKKIQRVKKDSVAEPKRSQKTKIELTKSKEKKSKEVKKEQGGRHVSKRQLDKFSREFMPIHTTSGKSRYQKLKNKEK